MSILKSAILSRGYPCVRGAAAVFFCALLSTFGAFAQEVTVDAANAEGAENVDSHDTVQPAAVEESAVTPEGNIDEANSEDGKAEDTAKSTITPEGNIDEANSEDGKAEDAAKSEDNALSLQTADQEYHLRLNQLEGKISDLKDQIFRSKAKLQMLTEEVTGGLGVGSGLVIVHYNDISAGFFQLIEVHYFLDGKELWQEVDDSGEVLTAKLERSILEGPMVEGSHTLTVSLVYRGNGSGLFSYLKGYTWRLKDSYTFTVEPGKQVFIQVHGFEQGNFTTELKDRPAIRFDTEIKDQQN